MSRSEFLDWFVAQHKPRLDSGMPNHTDQQLRDMVQAGKVAERVLSCRELWDEKRQSALYAWTARSAQTKEPKPQACACFPGTCRGGEVVDGRLANGLRCKASMPAEA